MKTTKEASNSDLNKIPVCFTSSAREAFSCVLKQINFKNNEYLLLPGYIGITDKEGSGVFDPVRGLQLKFDFYKVNARLELDYNDILKKVKERNVKAILIIHYFGVPQKSIQELKQFCKRQKISLIEDCAHAMDAFNQKNADMVIGKTGGYAFYSIHKYLPVKDGGFYTYDKNLDVLIEGKRGENISHEALYIAHVADYDEIRRKRIANYKYMLSLLPKAAKHYDVLHPKLPKGIVPLNFPVVIHNGNRENIYFKLIDKNVTVMALYYRMIEQIDKKKFPVSYSISESILNFPIHQEIEKKEIEYMVNVFGEILRKL